MREVTAWFLVFTLTIILSVIGSTNKSNEDTIKDIKECMIDLSCFTDIIKHRLEYQDCSFKVMPEDNGVVVTIVDHHSGNEYYITYLEALGTNEFY